MAARRIRQDRDRGRTNRCTPTGARGRIVVWRDTTPLQRPRRVNCCVERNLRYVATSARLMCCGCFIAWNKIIERCDGMANRDTMPQAKIGCPIRLLGAIECAIRFRSTAPYPAASKRPAGIDRKASRQDRGLALSLMVYQQ